MLSASRFLPCQPRNFLRSASLPPLIGPAWCVGTHNTNTRPAALAGNCAGDAALTPALPPPLNVTATALRFTAATCLAHHVGCITVSKPEYAPTRNKAAKRPPRSSFASSATKSTDSNGRWNAPHVAALATSPALTSRKHRPQTYHTFTATLASSP